MLVISSLVRELRLTQGKTEAVKNWPRPLTTIDLWSFLGLSGYYRRFMDGFSSIASHSTTLTQKSRKYEWSEACERSFQILKDRLTSTPVLTLPEGTNFFLYIVMHTEWV